MTAAASNAAGSGGSVREEAAAWTTRRIDPALASVLAVLAVMAVLPLMWTNDYALAFGINLL
jgi:hypothetical protein